MALFVRRETVSGLVQPSDRGVQYLAIRYTERLSETANGLSETEFIRAQGPWRTVELGDRGVGGLVERAAPPLLVWDHFVGRV